MERIALDPGTRHGGIETEVEAAVVADQDRPLAAIGLQRLADAAEDLGECRFLLHRHAQRVVKLDAGEFQRGRLDVGAFEGLDAEEVGVFGNRKPFSSMPTVVAAISSNASVAELKPPVSTSTTTGR